MKKDRSNYSKQYYQENKDIINKKKRMYRQEHREEQIQENKQRTLQIINKKRNDPVKKLEYVYKNMIKRSRDKGWTEIIPEKEFIEFGINNLEYIRISCEWVTNNYLHKLCPSIDRIDNNKGYVEGNLQFLTQKDNCRKCHKDIKFNYGRKKVKLFLDGKEEIFPSGQALASFLGINNGFLHRSIKKNKLCKGYKVEYV